MLKHTFALLTALLLTLPCPAQNGDKAGETQAMRVPSDKIPPSPQLTPHESLARISLPPGYRIDLVAAEPMLEAPVAAQFDADGRLFVVEMPGYMRSPEGTGEQEPMGRISILEDLNGDGVMDRKTLFLEGLVLPRALGFAAGGVLVAEPPALWFCRDTNGDGKADEKTLVASDYGDRKNPEHNASGLTLAMDNWVYNLYHTWRYRRSGGAWIREPIPNRVQWGLSQDDFGRLFFTQNSDLLRSDLYPSSYAGRAPTARIPFLNYQTVSSQAVWPSRITAGVNRGYQPATLGPDHRLANFTAACGTLIYRGDNLPSSARNQAFVCEPSANLIRLQHLWEDGTMLRSSNGMGRAEFLTSTDERFRPVNLIDGPDGGLYVIDIGRGVIQHRIYMTTYLRKQVEDRGLDKPLEVGRIYRITHRQGEIRPRTKLSRASSAELVALLKHPNGWHRDTAQRLLVERADASVVSALSDLARRPGDVRFRLHAFWTLEGMGKMEAGLVEEMLRDSEPWIQRTGLRFAEPYLKAAQEGKTTITKAVQQALWNKSLGVRVQAALSLGVAGSASHNAAALKQLHEATGSEWLKQAAALGLGLLDAKTNTVNAAQLASMSDAERKRFQAGKEVYSMVCGACHQPHGLGQEGLAPPLAESEWTGGSADRLIRMVLHGVRGPIKVKGQTYQLEMPPLNILNDDQVADVLTYIRKEWGHSFSPVSAAAVKAVRDATAQREQAWTEEELLKLP